MSASMRLFTLQVPASGEPVGLDPIPVPANVRITMAAIDPTANAEGDGPKLATLKIIHRPFATAFKFGDYLDDYEDDDEDDDEDYDEEGDEEETSKTPNKKNAAKAIQKLLDEASAMEVDSKKGGKKNAKKAAKEDSDEEEDDEEDSDDDEDDEEVGVEESVVCTLDPARLYQQTLDLVVAEGEEVLFKTSGAFTIYLSGNYIEAEEDSEDEEGSDYDLSPDEDEYYLNGAGDSEDESDELDDVDDPRISEVTSDDESAKAAEVKPISKKEKKAAAKAARDAATVVEKTVEKIVAADPKPAESKAAANASTKKRAADAMDIDVTTETATTPEGTKVTITTATASTEAPVLSKKQQKKLKANSGEPVQPPTPQSDKKKVQFAANLETGPTPNGNKSAPAASPSEKKAAAATTAPAATKTVNGVTLFDKKTGEGPEAKSGKRVAMRYIGKLQNGKTFDSNTKGKPFSFKLGAGEVIKGWDIGIAGMKVGGERKLTIPANLAYGSQSMPGIPKNSTLIFEVKLLEIK